MPSERELRRRAKSIRNIQQVTRALQLVAASKMRRAQEMTLASRPFEERLRIVLNDLAPYAEKDASPLLVNREPKATLVILVTTDRGLVGPMNVNLLRSTLKWGEGRPNVSYVGVGRKGITSLRRMRLPLVAEFANIPDRATTMDTNPIARVAIEEFLAGRADRVYISFTRFVNVLRQVPTTRRLLPLVPEEEDIDTVQPIQYIFEPDPVTVLSRVLPRLVELSVYQSILEMKASQYSAQMVAMRNATEAAKDLIAEFTLQANKARQTRITKEMLEIASGAEALSKG